MMTEKECSESDVGWMECTGYTGERRGVGWLGWVGKVGGEERQGWMGMGNGE